MIPMKSWLKFTVPLNCNIENYIVVFYAQAGDDGDDDDTHF